MAWLHLTFDLPIASKPFQIVEAQFFTSLGFATQPNHPLEHLSGNKNAQRLIATNMAKPKHPVVPLIHKKKNSLQPNTSHPNHTNPGCSRLQGQLRNCCEEVTAEKQILDAGRGELSFLFQRGRLVFVGHSATSKLWKHLQNTSKPSMCCELSRLLSTGFYMFLGVTVRWLELGQIGKVPWFCQEPP